MARADTYINMTVTLVSKTYFVFVGPVRDNTIFENVSLFSTFLPYIFMFSFVMVQLLYGDHQKKEIRVDMKQRHNYTVLVLSKLTK